MFTSLSFFVGLHANAVLFLILSVRALNRSLKYMQLAGVASSKQDAALALEWANKAYNDQRYAWLFTGFGIFFRLLNFVFILILLH